VGLRAALHFLAEFGRYAGGVPAIVTFRRCSNDIRHVNLKYEINSYFTQPVQILMRLVFLALLMTPDFL
jgi:hypothetical protein